MTTSGRFFSASAAAHQLGVSNKALRIYEQRGLLVPDRTAAGYRAYGAEQMVRARQIVALRALGLSLGQVAQVLDGDAHSLELALAAHEAKLAGELRKLVDTANKVRRLRADIVQGQTPAAGELASLLKPSADYSVAFDLPWPWGGERFELREIRPINYIVGPLGSGKTRFAQRLAAALPDAAYLGLERLDDSVASAAARLDMDAVLEARVGRTLAALIREGAVESGALVALLVGLEAQGPNVLVVDMVEQELDRTTQEALIAHLRHRASRPGARPLFLMTRSASILDLLAIGPDEAILFCPANHDVPVRVAPYPDAPGFEAVAMCLASPEVRARTAGVIALRRAPPMAALGATAVTE